MAQFNFKCPECGLYFFSRELALYALLAGCPGCGQGLYGGPVAQASRLGSIYRCADGTEIPDRPSPLWWHSRPCGAGLPVAQASLVGRASVPAILITPAPNPPATSSSASGMSSSDCSHEIRG